MSPISWSPVPGRRQVGDASHGQSGQVAHGDAHVLSHRYGQGPWWWRAGLLPPAGSRDRPASCREHAGAPRRWVGPCRGPSAPPGAGPWPSARSLLTPGTDEDLDVLDIHLSCRLSVKSIRGQPVDNRSRTHACERPLPFCGGSFPLSAVTSARLPQVTPPRIIRRQGQDTMPTATGPAPGTYH